MLLMHIGGAIVALVLGAFQFNPRIRNRHLRLHRAMGRTYLIAVLVGGIGGLAHSTVAYGGLPTRVGFALLAASWLASGALAYRRIRAGDTVHHREWMIRCYALTMAGVTLRLWQPLLGGGFGVPFAESYVTVAWLAWVPNLMVAEWWIHRTQAPARRQVVETSIPAAG